TSYPLTFRVMSAGLPVIRLRSRSTRTFGPLSKLVTVCLVRLAAWPTLRITGAPWRCAPEALWGTTSTVTPRRAGGEVHRANDPAPEKVRRPSPVDEACGVPARGRWIRFGGEQVGSDVLVLELGPVEHLGREGQRQRGPD